MNSQNKKTVAVIQARMGSTRLPGKTLISIAGKPTIEHVISRVRKAVTIDEVLLATTTNPEDDAVVAWAKKYGVAYYQGSVDDVLDRYYQAALEAEADIVVRITGDCPLIDPEVIDQVVQAFLKEKCDYVSNTQAPTFPDGLDTEIFSIEALTTTHAQATLRSDREHVTPYIWKHPDIFKLGSVKHDTDLSTYRWTLDTKEDATFIGLVIEELNHRGLTGTMEEVLTVIHDNPQWLKINTQYERNEGYAKSLKEDSSI